MTNKKLKIILANPRGFCAGVDRAIEIVERALILYGPPVYVRHEIVHNKHVVESLRAKGAVFVDEVSDIPKGSHTIFSAHGVSNEVVKDAAERGLPIIDATCPLVSKVHKEGQNHAKQNRQVILIGHQGHPEVEGTQGRIPGGVLLVTNVKDVASLEVKDPAMLAFVTQTTLSVDDTKDIIKTLKDRFPAIKGPDVKDICYATQNRQQAIKDISSEIDMLLVVGAKNSSNSNRLRDLAAELGKPSYLIDDASDLKAEWFEKVQVVGLTAGASAPEQLVQGVITHLGDFGEIDLHKQSGIDENVVFKVPKELTDAEIAAAKATT